MDRRWAGLLLVIGCLAATVIAAGLTHTTIPGRSQIGPAPGPPTVGDCVTGPIDVGVTWVQSNGNSLPAYPQVASAPCVNGRQGEVVAVLDTVPLRSPIIETTVTAVNGDQDFAVPVTVDPLGLDCQRSAEDYAGIPADQRMSVAEQFVQVPSGQWLPLSTVKSGIFRPTARQVDAGQGWGACAILPNEYGRSFSESMKNVYRAGYPAADLISVCGGIGDDPAMISGPELRCDSAHRFEDFARAAVRGSSSLEDLRSSCRVLIVNRTGLTDPTVGGALAVNIAASFYDASGAHIGFGPGGYATCQLMTTDAGRSLFHSLANIGTRPLPWSP